MEIVIKKTLATISEFYFKDSFKELSRFYNTLDIYNEEYLFFNPSNIKKIIEYFNDSKNCDIVGKEMIKDTGLLGLAEHKELTVFEIQSSQNSTVISQIIVYHRINITDEKLKEHYKNSLSEFYNFLKKNVEDEKVSIYSLYSEDSIECLNISSHCRKEKIYYPVRLEGSYSIEKENLKHLDKYKNEKCIYKMNLSNDGRMNITISKSY